ncbi:MAG: formylglycine-generating enzyme family protein [Planctomycetota bacterium]|nr:formylglycine-generating enzyme family protein [Planctomycetota bacterium]
MARSTAGWMLGAGVVLCLASWAMAGAEADYQALFGEEEKAVVGKGPRASAEFAGKVLQAAKALDKDKGLQAILCEKAYEFGMKDSAGYGTAIDAMKFLAQVAPEKKGQAQEKLIEASQVRYAKSAGAERRTLGEELIGLLVAGGDERAGLKKPMEAISLYRKALDVATGAGSGRVGEITDRIKQTTAGVEAEARLTGLKNKLKENPKSVAARTNLILAYLGEFDNPAEAVKLVTDDLDEKVRTYVPLSAKPVSDLAEGACLELATWYADVAEKASPAGKGVLLGKSNACCERFLELHTDQDVARLKGTMLLEKVAKAGEKAGLEFARWVRLDLGKGVVLKLVVIPAGKFTMGSPESEKDRGVSEGPPRAVTISKAFCLGVYEVTQEQYEAVMGANPSAFKGAKNPAEQVSWDDAVEFCKKLSAKTGKAARLPTEAQWEYACRAGGRTRFGFGETDAALGEYAWCNTNSGGTTHPVGQKKPNAWGLYDMHGNVWEWCSDWYEESYANAGTRDPQGVASGTRRVLRGGCWGFYPQYCRSACRSWGTPPSRAAFCGFRVVVDAK